MLSTLRFLHWRWCLLLCSSMPSKGNPRPLWHFRQTLPECVAHQTSESDILRCCFVVQQCLIVDQGLKCAQYSQWRRDEEGGTKREGGERNLSDQPSLRTRGLDRERWGGGWGRGEIDWQRVKYRDLILTCKSGLAVFHKQKPMLCHGYSQYIKTGISHTHTTSLF